MQELKQAIARACQDVFNVGIEPELTRPDEQFGDYATNAALQLAKQLANPPAGGPREVAEKLVESLREKLAEQTSEVTIAGPGFINMRLNDEALWQLTQRSPARGMEGQTVVAEYSDPNPFKVLHAGHLYTSLVGDAIAKLLEASGADVKRVNFGGDVGLHVGKAMWAILRELGGEQPEKLQELPEDQKLDWISARYVVGNEAYESDEKAKKEIIEVNKRVYQLHADNDHDSPFAQIYWTCRQWSYDGFDALYEHLGMAPFDTYYPESSVGDMGLEIVKRHTGTVYEESDGAVIFRGEPHGLFTQVFINGEGLPTYAGKDVGLIHKKHQDFAPDRSFIITDVAQKDHLAVVMKSVEQYAPELVAATTHYTHGQIKLAGGVKMSSRKGNILRAADVLEAATEANKLLTGEENDLTVLAAVKYAFLKQRIGGDIVYDPAESVALEGNSGPYLQYAHARARSILKKSSVGSNQSSVEELEAGERSLLRKISEFPELVDKAVQDLMPHHICTYLYELAQVFNHFYEHNRVIGDPRQEVRLHLVQSYAGTLKKGLELLNIPAPERM